MAIDRGPIGTIVPCLSPPNLSSWYTLAGTASRYPRVRTIAVVDPGIVVRSGLAKPDYLANIGMLKNSGVEVWGLLDVRLDSDVSDDMWRLKAYAEFYPDITGIMFQDTISFNTIQARSDFDKRIVPLVKAAKNADLQAALAITIQDVDPLSMATLDKFLEVMTVYDQLDIVLINLFEGITPDTIGKMKRAWMDKSSKFAVMLTPKDPLKINEFRNQIYAVYTHDVARYIYIRGSDSTDQEISPYFESLMSELDKLAESEGKTRPADFAPTGYDLSPNTVGTPGGGKEHPGGADGIAKQDTAPGAREEFAHGIKKLYPDSDTPYYAMISDIPTVFRGKISTDEFKDGIENIEYTTYIRRVDKKEKLEPHDILYAFRLGRKSSGYCASVASGGYTTIGKTVNGVACQPRAGQGTNHSLREWLGFKFVFYQYYPADYIDDVNQKHIRIQLWMDENCTTNQGELFIANKWRMVQETDDHGNWVYPKKTKKVPKDGFLVINGKMDAMSVEFDNDIKVEMGFTSVRSIKAPRAD